MSKIKFKKLRVGDKVKVRDLIFGYSIHDNNILKSKRGIGPFKVTVIGIGNDFIRYQHKFGNSTTASVATRWQIL